MLAHDRGNGAASHLADDPMSSVEILSEDSSILRSLKLYRFHFVGTSSLCVHEKRKCSEGLSRFHQPVRRANTPAWTGTTSPRQAPPKLRTIANHNKSNPERLPLRRHSMVVARIAISLGTYSCFEFAATMAFISPSFVSSRLRQQDAQLSNSSTMGLRLRFFIGCSRCQL